jgi:hypothetical protein
MSTSTNNQNNEIDSSSTSQFTEMQSRNSQTLTDIQGLQDIEKGLFTTLEAGLANNTISPDQQEKIISKINELSNMRVNLYKNLNGLYGFFQKNMTSSRDTISEQTAAIDIVENELNESKRRLQMIQQENNNKIRLVEINTYYGEQYADYANIMKLIVIFCIPILMLTILANREILPKNIYFILFTILIVVGVIYIGRQIITAFSRDRMNYSEFDWNTKKSSLPKIDTSKPNGSDPWLTNALMCSGGACCPENYSYSNVQNKCISNELLDEANNMEQSADFALNSYMEGSKKNDFPYKMGGYGSL